MSGTSFTSRIWLDLEEHNDDEDALLSAGLSFKTWTL